jgi:hypothetical protein
MKTHSLLLIALLVAGGWSASPTAAQVAAVTMNFDSSTIPVGGSTLLHVYAQVVPEQRTNSDRIFSWYVDLLNGTPGVAQADYSQLQKPTSDKNPQTSSFGTTQGANQTGIFDTFINDTPVSKSGTGVNAPVELFNVQVQGLSAGQTTFRVGPGSGVSGLAEDFIVAPLAGDTPLVGGVYNAASAVLQVGGSGPCRPLLSAAYLPGSGVTHRVSLIFVPCPGQTNVVEFRDSLTGGSWQALPGAPHNSGFVTDTNSVASRFYRVRTGS